MKKLNALLVFSLVLLAGCSSNHKAILKYREMVQKKDYKSALEMMKGDSIYKDEQSRLLKFLELGTLHLYSGEYFQALQYFDRARDLSDKLFTVSISKKIAGTTCNNRKISCANRSSSSRINNLRGTYTSTKLNLSTSTKRKLHSSAFLRPRQTRRKIVVTFTTSSQLTLS